MNRKALILQLEKIIGLLKFAYDPSYCDKRTENRPKDIRSHLLCLIEGIEKGDFNKNGTKWKD